MFDVIFRQTFRRQHIRKEPNRKFLIEKCSNFSLKMIKQHIFNLNAIVERRVIVRIELKISSPGITARHYSARLLMPNSYPRDGIFNPNLTIIKDSYILKHLQETSTINISD